MYDARSNAGYYRRSMIRARISGCVAVAMAMLCVACAAFGPLRRAKENSMFEPMHVPVHRGDDDLLTAGLGMDGLRKITPPAFVDPEHPTATELRRRAIWNNWRGIADLTPDGGYGALYGHVTDAPGREFATLATLPD